MRAQTPRRFGTTASSRPPAASTRQTSRSKAAGSCAISSACTSSTRSIEESASGSSSSSTSAARLGPIRRPFHHALRRRHEGETALRLLAKEAEIGCRIAHAEHAQPAGVGEAGTDATTDEAARHDAQALGVEGAQIDDVDGHGEKVARLV
jgi:hypothetical protein